MFKRAMLSLLALLMVATPALAEEGKAPTKDVGQYVDLEPMAMPIVIKGQLVNYVFVHVRINLTTSADVVRLRDKEPYFRDALVRIGHRTPFIVPNDNTRIDEAKLCASLMREATAIAGPGNIKSVVVSSQTARGRMPTGANAPSGHP